MGWAGTDWGHLENGDSAPPPVRNCWGIILYVLVWYIYVLWVRLQTNRVSKLLRVLSIDMSRVLCTGWPIATASNPEQKLLPCCQTCLHITMLFGDLCNVLAKNIISFPTLTLQQLQRYLAIVPCIRNEILLIQSSGHSPNEAPQFLFSITGFLADACSLDEDMVTQCWMLLKTCSGWVRSPRHLRRTYVHLLYTQAAIWYW